MVKKALDSLIKMDAKMAQEVCVADDEVDNINKEILLLVQDYLVKNPQEV